MPMLKILRAGTAFWSLCTEAFGVGFPRPQRSDTLASPGRGPLPAYPRRPRSIFATYPEEGSIAGPVPEIGAGFLLHGPMLKGSAMDEGAFSLALDDEDVTAETSVLSSMDHPQSHGTLLYRPKSPLAPGRHEASVSFPGEADGRCKYAWYFEVRPDHREHDDRFPASSEVPPPSKVTHSPWRAPYFACSQVSSRAYPRWAYLVATSHSPDPRGVRAAVATGDAGTVRGYR